MAFNSKVTCLANVIDLVSLTNGDRVQLACMILESCDPSPDSPLGKLFDTSVEGLRFVLSVCEEVNKKK